jgi:RNAse (barnase) inhibitor barstar
MSGLAGLLAGHRPAGLYRWPDTMPEDDVRRVVEHAGWGAGVVDGWTHPGKAGLLAQVAQALAFPEWFGQNFDALADCLSDVPGPTVLVWDGWGPLAREDPAAFTVALEVLGERAARTPMFAVLLRGDGPDIEVPELR